MPITRLAGLAIDIAEFGHGPPLLFLHGGGGFRGDEPFVPLLAEGRRLIVPSHPGFGDSDLPDWMDRVGDIAMLYLDLLDRIGHAELDVVGCSFGGWIAVTLAVLAPQRIRGIALVGPSGLRIDGHALPDLFALPEDEVAHLLYRDPARHRRDPATLDAIAAARAWRDRQAFARFARDPCLHDPKLIHWLHRIRTPVLLMRGEHDGLISAGYLAAYAEHFADARIATIPGAGHLPQIEQPGLFADLTRAFLRGEI